MKIILLLLLDDFVFKHLKSSAEKGEIIDWVVDVVRAAGADACPPFVVGVGIGGDFETSSLLSKKALCRNLGDRNGDEFYAKLESDLLSAINGSALVHRVSVATPPPWPV